MNKQNPIGFLGGGLSGLTVVREAASLMPNENILFYGDLLHSPYSAKSAEIVKKLSLKGARYLAGKNAKTIVVASCSISAAALNEIKNNFEMPVIDLVEPSVKKALMVSSNRKIAVVSSSAVLNSDVFDECFSKAAKKIKLIKKPVPLLISAAEECITAGKPVLTAAREYLFDLKEKNVDTVILGSSALPILYELIAKVMGKKVNIINPAAEASYILRDYLEGRGIRSQSVQAGMLDFHVNDMPLSLGNKSEVFFGRKHSGLYKTSVNL